MIAPQPSAVAARPSRITERFTELRKTGELGVVAYLTAGDPSIAATEKIVLALADAGADVIELGVPFSDPLADGPTIQRASERALRSGANLSAILDLVARLRQKSAIPLIIFSYFNPVLQMGVGPFAEGAASAGVDGVLIIDLTPEEAGDYLPAIKAKGLNTIFLAAPTSPDERLEKIATVSSGFLYLISRTGVTGAKDALPDDLPELVRRTRRVTALPIAIGFGISLPGHVAILGGLADAAVVGSAIVAEIEGAGSTDAACEAVSKLVRSLKHAARQGMSRRETLPRGTRG